MLTLLFFNQKKSEMQQKLNYGSGRKLINLIKQAVGHVVGKRPEKVRLDA